MIIQGQNSDGHNRIPFADELAASFATTLKALLTAAAGYGWDSVNSLWRRLAVDADGQLQLAGYESVSKSSRVSEIDPLSERFVNMTVWDETNYDDAGPSTLYGVSDMAGYTRPSWQYDLNKGGGTIVMTIEATWQDDGTAPGSCAYEDVTLALTGAASISGTASGIIVDNAGVLENAKYVRVKLVVNTDPADDADFTIFHNKLWR